MKTSELIARDIVHDISAGGLQDGDALPPEAKMLEYYDVGRASLREALRVLEVNGLVQIRAGAKGGPVVGSARADNLGRMLTLYFGIAGSTYEDLTDVILIIYPLVAELAATRKLSKAEREMLKAAVDVGCETNANLARDEALGDFHSVLARISNNPVWALLADSVGLVFSEHVMSTADSSAFHKQTAADHNEIADAVLARDPERARQAMREHTVRIIKFYRSQNPGIFSQLIEWR